MQFAVDSCLDDHLVIDANVATCVAVDFLIKINRKYMEIEIEAFNPIYYRFVYYNQ